MSIENKPADSKKRDTAKKWLVGDGIVGATAFTQNEWIEPVVESDVLPAHAGVSREPPPRTWT